MTERPQICIFLDLDGVMADFDRHAEETGKRLPTGKPDWDNIDEKWWTTMPPCDGAKDFYKAARKLGAVNFLSSPWVDESSFSGKAIWLKSFLPERGRFVLKDLILCASNKKHFLARPHHILVDDRISNIEEWVTAGGIGIHHTTDLAKTLKKLKAEVDKLGGPTPADAFNKKAKKKSKPSSKKTPTRKPKP